MDEKNPQSWLTGVVLGASNATNESEKLDWVITIKNREYHVNKVIGEGDLSMIYEGYFANESESINIIVKVIKEEIDNKFANNEIKILNALFAEENQNQVHLPKFLDRFKTKEKTVGIILQKFEGFNLNQIREHPLYVSGVPDYHAAWMLCRILAAVGYAHSKGIFHCNIEPAHILIKPVDLLTNHKDDHNACLIDWSYASINKAGFRAVNDDYSAPEVQKKDEPKESSDMYSIGKCMIYLLGGNLEDNSLPDTVDPRFQRFIENFLISSPIQRARDAWDMAKKLYELRKEIWGDIGFQVFEF